MSAVAPYLSHQVPFSLAARVVAASAAALQYPGAGQGLGKSMERMESNDSCASLGTAAAIAAMSTTRSVVNPNAKRQRRLKPQRHHTIKVVRRPTRGHATQQTRKSTARWMTVGSRSVPTTAVRNGGRYMPMSVPEAMPVMRASKMGGISDLHGRSEDCCGCRNERLGSSFVDERRSSSKGKGSMSAVRTRISSILAAFSRASRHIPPQKSVASTGGTS